MPPGTLYHGGSHHMLIGPSHLPQVAPRFQQYMFFNSSLGLHFLVMAGVPESGEQVGLYRTIVQVLLLCHY
jgi:hypothetical protein